MMGKMVSVMFFVLLRGRKTSTARSGGDIWLNMWLKWCHSVCGNSKQWIRVQQSLTYGKPWTLFRMMLSWALLQARMGTPAVYEEESKDKNWGRSLIFSFSFKKNCSNKHENPRKTKQQNLEAKLDSIREICVYNSQTMRYFSYCLKTFFSLFGLLYAWYHIDILLPPIVRRMRSLSSFHLCVLFESLFNQEVKLLATKSQCYRKYVLWAFLSRNKEGGGTILMQK